MCGRYASAAQTIDLVNAFALAGYHMDPLFSSEAYHWSPSWNIAPGQMVRIVVDRPRPATGRVDLVDAAGTAVTNRTDPDTEADTDCSCWQVHLARWGLVPSWAKDPRIGHKMINARRETVADKPAFRAAVRTRRCLIPAMGYYEWQHHDSGPTTPWFIHPSDTDLTMFAGLYEFWRDPNDPSGPWLTTTTIITTAALPQFADIHDRRPVMLAPDTWAAWLSADTPRDHALSLLDAPPVPAEAHRVARTVGNVVANGPDLIVPVESTPTAP